MQPTAWAESGHRATGGAFRRPRRYSSRPTQHDEEPHADRSPHRDHGGAPRLNPAPPRKAKDRAESRDPRTLDMFDPPPRRVATPRPARARRKPGPGAPPPPSPETASADPVPALAPDERAELERLRLRAEESEREYQDGRALIESIEGYLAEEYAKSEALARENEQLRGRLGEWLQRTQELEREREQLVGILITLLKDRNRQARKQAGF
ncbi:hypothetical protein SAMN02949497_0026 [Methylomagnum ishizawai]|uniref:Uncharacterized protein n=1 Tax=Methylomagnum ishizawai TaxID=1760988 RepID=A0A1Y6D5Q6_9GAMM|nr:hypothetical protein SAMN02949497_0026 [Methylomagnum ishizawai]